MKMYSQDIIARLKQYPRHGGGGTRQKSEQRKKETQKQIEKQTSDEYTKVTNIYAQLEQNIVTLAESEAKLANGVGKVMKVHQDLASRFKELADDINVLAQRNAGLQKEFGLTQEKAGALGYQLDSFAVSMGTSRENVEKSYIALRKLTGGTRENTQTLLELNKYYTVNRGLTQEATDGLLAFAAAQTKAGTDEEIKAQVDRQREMYKTLEEVTGIKGAQRDIEEEIGTAAANTRLTFKKYPAQLGMAVMKAKALGLTLGDLASIGDNLLSIESSVGEELNYQLLTGHRLVDNQGKSLTNKYREAYLTGKSNDAAQTMVDILNQEGDTLENNMLARKQMAKTLGIEEDKLSAMVEKRKLIKTLTDASGKPLSVDLFTKTGAELEKGIRDAMKGKTEEEITAAVEAVKKKEDDAKTPEARTAEILGKIEAEGIKLQMTGADGGYNAQIIKGASEALEKSFESFKTTMTTTFNTYAKSSAEDLGENQIRRQAYDTEGIIADLFKIEEGQGGLGAVLASTAKELLNKIVGADAIKTFMQGSKVESMTITGENVTVAGAGNAQDAVMINDGLVSFNARDKFRTINDGMTMAGTNVGGLDRYAAQMEKRDRNFEQTMSRLIANMSSAVTQAIERANLKVNVDRTFGGTSMNPIGKYGAR